MGAWKLLDYGGRKSTMISVEKKPAIAPEVFADLEAVCNRDGIVRDPILCAESPIERPNSGERPLSISASRRLVRRLFARCTTRNEICYRCIDGIPMEVSEPDSPKAIQLREDYRSGVHELISPDIFPAEAGNALLVAERKGRIVAGQFAVSLTAILASCPDLHTTRPLIPPRRHIIASVTTGFRVSFYDALYVALAERESCDLISGGW